MIGGDGNEILDSGSGSDYLFVGFGVGLFVYPFEAGFQSTRFSDLLAIARTDCGGDSTRFGFGCGNSHP